MPALLTSTSIRPNSRWSPSANVVTSSQWPTWHGRPTAFPPPALSSAAAFSHASALRLTTTTSAPAWLNAPAMARPRPRVPPVTTATRPVRSNRPDAGWDVRCTLPPSVKVTSLQYGWSRGWMQEWRVSTADLRDQGAYANLLLI